MKTLTLIAGILLALWLSGVALFFWFIRNLGAWLLGDDRCDEEADMSETNTQMLLGADGLWWDGKLPYSVKPYTQGGPTQGTINYEPSGPAPCDWVNVSGEMIDCRIPEEARRRMALGEAPLVSYSEWEKSQ